jgi:hypothetical protein
MLWASPLPCCRCCRWLYLRCNPTDVTGCFNSATPSLAALPTLLLQVVVPPVQPHDPADSICMKAAALLLLTLPYAAAAVAAAAGGCTSSAAP